MNIVFVGESWFGSSARTMKEGLRRVMDPNGDRLDELNEDLIVPRSQRPLLRAINRVLAPAFRRELGEAIVAKCRTTKPDALIVYKGGNIEAHVVREVKQIGVMTVNVFPDYSPHAYGSRLREAIGEFDLVCSTKPFHASSWGATYGYSNECVFVPHGYDPQIHLRTTQPTEWDYDVGLAATWRPQYHELIASLGEQLSSPQIRVAIAGTGWAERARSFPAHWVFPGPVGGAAYTEWVRRCRIMIAPVNSEVIVDGRRQPGDEDTSRTYELAAAYCFFVHQRTDFVRTLYDERREVPLYLGAGELASLINYYLSNEEQRCDMAAAAHERAVPAYSVDRRAAEIIEIIKNRLSAEYKNDAETRA